MTHATARAPPPTRTLDGDAAMYRRLRRRRHQHQRHLPRRRGHPHFFHPPGSSRASSSRNPRSSSTPPPRVRRPSQHRRLPPRRRFIFRNIHRRAGRARRLPPGRARRRRRSRRRRLRRARLGRARACISWLGRRSVLRRPESILRRFQTPRPSVPDQHPPRRRIRRRHRRPRQRAARLSCISMEHGARLVRISVGRALRVHPETPARARDVPPAGGRAPVARRALRPRRFSRLPRGSAGDAVRLDGGEPSDDSDDDGEEEYEKEDAG